MLRFVAPFLVVCTSCLGAAALPDDLATILRDFRADGPRGWSFTQTTRAGKEALVERFDAAQPELSRWSLLKKDDRTPTAGELKTYNEGKTRRSGGLNAPRIQDLIDLSTAKLAQSGDGRATWTFRMKAGGPDDGTASHMSVAVTFNLAARTVERVEIASDSPYAPVLGVRIAESKTSMEYSLPAAGRPSLLQKITLRLRGRAFLFKSLDQDMTVIYSDHAPAAKP